MSSEISLSEVQEFFGEFWFHYDSGHYDEIAVRFAEDANYISRSESGASPFEEVLAANLHGRDEIIGWLTEHREGSPYPLRHNGTNIHRTGTDGDVTTSRSYMFVTQVANHVPFAVSSGVLETGIKRGAERSGVHHVRLHHGHRQLGAVRRVQGDGQRRGH